MKLFISHGVTRVRTEKENAPTVAEISADWLRSFGSHRDQIARYMGVEMDHAEGIRLYYDDESTSV